MSTDFTREEILAELGTHEDLVHHELGHALAAQRVGARVITVAAPPFDVRDVLEDPGRPLGQTLFYDPRDPRDHAIVILSGNLAEGKSPPSWPVDPRRNSDARQLAKVVRDMCEYEYAELVCAAKTLVADDRHVRSVAAELLEHTHQLTGDQLDHIRKSLTKTQHDRDREHDPEPPDSDRDEDGVISDEQVERDLAAMNQPAPVGGHSPRTIATTNGTKALANTFDWPKDLFGSVEPPAPIPGPDLRSMMLPTQRKPDDQDGCAVPHCKRPATNLTPLLQEAPRAATASTQGPPTLDRQRTRAITTGESVDPHRGPPRTATYPSDGPRTCPSPCPAASRRSRNRTNAPGHVASRCTLGEERARRQPFRHAPGRWSGRGSAPGGKRYDFLAASRSATPK